MFTSCGEIKLLSVHWRTQNNHTSTHYLTDEWCIPLFLQSLVGWCTCLCLQSATVHCRCDMSLIAKKSVILYGFMTCELTLTTRCTIVAFTSCYRVIEWPSYLQTAGIISYRANCIVLLDCSFFLTTTSLIVAGTKRYELTNTLHLAHYVYELSA